MCYPVPLAGFALYIVLTMEGEDPVSVTVVGCARAVYKLHPGCANVNLLSVRQLTEGRS